MEKPQVIPSKILVKWFKKARLQTKIKKGNIEDFRNYISDNQIVMTVNEEPLLHTEYIIKFMDVVFEWANDNQIPIKDMYEFITVIKFFEINLVKDDDGLIGVQVPR